MLKISVVTPSFNQARYLGRTLDSVLGQEGDFELEPLVIDGGSTDGSLEIIRSYGGRIRWVSESDQGQADAINKGLALATGEVVCWLNSDDVFLPVSLAAVAKVFAAEPETQWLYGRVVIIDEADREIRRWITAYKNRRMRPWSYRRLLAENWISQMGVFWRRSAGEQIGPLRKDLHWCMDYDYWLRLGARWPGRFVDRDLAAFRWYPTTKSGAGFAGQFWEEYRVARSHAGGRRLPVAMHYLYTLRTIAMYRAMQLWRKVRDRLGSAAA
jgi:glycosyltransferase involved in cell wall biosynthesis